MKAETQEKMAEIAKRIYENTLSIENHGLTGYEKVMDVPDGWFDIEIFEKALAQAKELGAATFNVRTPGDKGFFKPYSRTDAIQADLNLLQELLNSENETNRI